MEDIKRAGRFKDAPWFPKEDIYVLIGGAGGIGSWLTLFLARAGFKPIVYDHDTVEVHNLGGQLFSTHDIGSTKVSALSDTVRMLTGEIIMGFDEKFDELSPTGPYCFSAFDNLAARKVMYWAWKKAHALSQEVNTTAIFIDGHLAAEQLTIYAIKANDPIGQDVYEKDYLSSKEEDIAEAPCTMKQTTHMAALIAAEMTCIFTNHITNVNEKADMRVVPLKKDYFSPMCLDDIILSQLK